MGFSSHNAKDHSYFKGLDIKKNYLASGTTDEFKVIEGDKSSNKAYKEDLDKFANMFEDVKRSNRSTLIVTERELAVEPHLLILEYFQNQ